MKGRQLIIGLIIAALGVAGFFAGRTCSRTRCPQIESDRLGMEINDMQNRLQRARQQIADLRRKHPHKKQK